MNSLSSILKHPSIKRGSQSENTIHERISLNDNDFDSLLKGGVPAFGVSRLTCEQGVGEVRYHLPLLLKKQAQEQLIVFVSPPNQISQHWFYQQSINPKLCLVITPHTEKEQLWSIEQCLKSAACSCVVLWQNNINYKIARRFQVLATQHQSLLLWFDHSSTHTQTLPIALDWQWEFKQHQWFAHIFKIQGGWASYEHPVSLTSPFSNSEINSAFSQHQLSKALPHNASK